MKKERERLIKMVPEIIEDHGRERKSQLITQHKHFKTLNTNTNTKQSFPLFTKLSLSLSLSLSHAIAIAMSFLVFLGTTIWLLSAN